MDSPEADQAQYTTEAAALSREIPGLKVPVFLCLTGMLFDVFEKAL
jgi:hypothetical protein